MQLISEIYYSSPVWLQNIATSLYGYKLYKQRYGGEHDIALDELMRSIAIKDNTLLKKLQIDMLQSLLKEAFEHVPFYRNLAKKSNYDYRDFTSLDKLKLLPIIEKTMIRKNYLDFCNEKVLKTEKCFELNTSGTTGTPLKIISDNKSRQRHYAFWTRLRLLNGLDLNSKRATFFGRIIMKASQRKAPFWRLDYFQNNLLFSSYHLLDKNLSSYSLKLMQYKPDEIIGYPSSLYQLARYLLKNKEFSVSPKVIFTTAETLLDYQREDIELAFNCPVIDQYGCTEMALFVSQNTSGNYYLHPEHGLAEVLKDDGSTSLTGSGEILCTGFVNRAMPLIRYRLGDTVEISDPGDDHDWQFPVVKSIEGRTDDILLMPDGTPIGRLDPVFKGLDNIIETQIIQENYNTLLVKVVGDASFNKGSEKSLMSSLKERVGEDMKVSIVCVDNIEKESNGKFRAIINKINKG